MPNVTVQQAFQLALQHHQAGRLAEAEGIYRQILAHDPRHADSLHLLGVIAHQAGRGELAVKMIREAIAVSPGNAAFHSNLGEAHRRLGQFAEAAAEYGRAVQLKPDYAEALSNLGNVLAKAGRFDEAVAHCRRALAIKPQLADAHNNLGVALVQSGRIDDAVTAFREAVRLSPDVPGLLSNLGGALSEAGRLAEAAAAYERALAPGPGLAEAHSNFATVLVKQGFLDRAMAAFRRALELQPDYLSAHSNLLVCMQASPDVDEAELFAGHRRWEGLHALPLAKWIGPHANSREPGRRLRIGYVSPDFREHSVAFFVEGLLANHDPAAVEVFSYADLRRADRFTARLRRHAGQWREITGMSDAEAAALIRRDEIDILVDLAGHTAANRLPLFARKPAPVQATWLGYCGTTGMSAMDWRITDAHADPPGETERYHVERLARLPGIFASFQPWPESPPPGPPRRLSFAENSEPRWSFSTEINRSMPS